jgi:hypothetical protein
MGDSLFGVLLISVSGAVAMGVCYAVSAGLASAFPSKEMLDVVAVEQEWKVDAKSEIT